MEVVNIFYYLAVILIFAKSFGLLARKLGLPQVAELRPNCTKAANRRSKLRILSGRAAYYDGVFPVRPCENKLKHK